MSSDVKQNLRKLEFPLCAKEALVRIEHLCSPQNVGRIQSVRQTDLAMELIADFVFCEADRRSSRRKKLNSIQELQLVEVLSDYFAYGNSNESEYGNAARNTIFMSLFPHTHLERCQFLIKLVSTAIYSSNIPILTATGVLMQQIGCTSKFSVELVKGIINDYFILAPKSIDKLQHLPIKAPLFTANFLTSLADIYCNIGKGEKFNEPSDELLHLITSWVSENNNLCFAAVISNLQAVLPYGAIPMPAITPFVGLIRWCVTSCIYKKECNVTYSKLQLALLESLLQCQMYLPSQGQKNVISAQQLTSLVTSYNVMLNDHVNRGYEKYEEDLANYVRISVESLIQFVQISLYTDSLYGSKQELISRLKALPPVRILNIVLRKYNEIV